LRSSRPSNRAALIAFKAVESCGSDREGNVLSRSQDGALLLGRLLVAGLFLPGGLNKLLTFSSFAASLGAKGLPPALAAAVIVAAEVLGPLALIIGLWPRWTAVVLIGFSAVTLWLTHRHAGVGVVFRSGRLGRSWRAWLSWAACCFTSRAGREAGAGPACAGDRIAGLP
jgi:putative oxidoreductase